LVFLSLDCGFNGECPWYEARSPAVHSAVDVTDARKTSAFATSYSH